MHCIWRQCCILTKFRFVIKSTYVFFFSSINMFLSRKYIMQWINTPALRERKFDYQFLTYVSSSTWCIKNIGLISKQFTGIDQIHIPDISTKIYANRMSSSSLFFVSKNGHCFCMHRLAHKRTQWPTTFRDWFCNSVANRHKICTRFRQRD